MSEVKTLSDIATIDDFSQTDDEELELAASLYFKKPHRVIETKAKLSFRDILLITTAMLFILDYQQRLGQINRNNTKARPFLRSHNSDQASSSINQS